MSRPPCSFTLPRDQAEALDSALGRVIDEYNDDLKDSIFDDQELAEKAEQLAKVEAARLTLTQTLWPVANPQPLLIPTPAPAQLQTDLIRAAYKLRDELRASRFKPDIRKDFSLLAADAALSTVLHKINPTTGSF